jgi:flagellar basal body-associated protein FliL
MEKKYLIIVALLIVAIAVSGYLYWKSAQKEKPLESAAENLGEVSQSVPEITTNPVEDEVPELNPVERTNPFKYENPLR